MHRNQLWNQVIQCSVIAAGFTAYLLYAWKKRTVWFLMRLISQKEEPDLYRTGMAFLIIFDAMVLYFLALRAYQLFKIAA